MWNQADARRRWFGLFFLIVAAGLLIWGQTVLATHLKGVGYIIYWSICFIFTFLAILTAMLDLVVMRRRIREQHRKLAEQAFGRPIRKKSGPSSNESSAPAESSNP